MDACSLRSAAGAAYRAHGTIVSAVDSSCPAGTTDGSDCCSTGCRRRELRCRSLTGRARVYAVLAAASAGLLSGAPSASPVLRASAKKEGENRAPTAGKVYERLQRKIHHRVDSPSVLGPTMRRHYLPDSASSVIVGQHRCSSSVGNAALASGVLVSTALALVTAGRLV